MADKKAEKKIKEETILISENPYKGTQMVVVQRTIAGKTNRVGNPYKTSYTEHRKVPKRRVKGEQDE